MKKIQFFLIACFTLSVQIVFAQKTSKQETERLTNLYNQLDGTYQLQIIDSREKPTLRLTYMDSIVAKRKQTETIYFQLKHNMRIMVPPYSVINDKKTFKPLQRVAHISASDK